MNIKTFGIAGALVALALMIGLVVGTNSINAKPPSGGSVFVTGHDPDYHAHPDEISCDGTPGAENLLKIAIKYARNGSNKPLLVVHPYDPSIPFGHRDSLVGLETVDTNYYTTAIRQRSGPTCPFGAELLYQ